MKSQKSFSNQKQSSFLSKLFFTFSPLLVFSIQENSMIPLLKPNDQILVSKLSSIHDGDIVVCKNPHNDPLRSYIVKKISQIKDGKVYLEGINKNESVDSRTFGWIQRKSVIGKMIYKL